MTGESTANGRRATDPKSINTELRAVLGRFATGITVVTAGRDTPRGMTANSFTSVSLDPPMVLLCAVRDAAMHRTIQSCRSFAVSVLSAHQEKLARHFANRGRPRGDGEFDLVDCVPGPHTGAPIVAGALAWLECELAAVYDGGDHVIVLGSVLDIGRGPEHDALLFYQGDFHRLTPDRRRNDLVSGSEPVRNRPQSTAENSYRARPGNT